MKTEFSPEEFEKCFNFPVNYYLDSKRSNINRTTGQSRGLGAVINDFFIGKMVEVGVSKIINSRNTNIECLPDFSIYDSQEDHANDPDIVSILDKGAKRDPNIFIEIKNISERDRYVGLTAEQLVSITGNKKYNKDSSFIIFASIKSSNSEKDSDLFGVFLKNKIKNIILNNFADIGDVYLEIKNIMSIGELIKYGKEFNKGSFLYETEILSIPMDESKKQRLLSGGFEKKLLKNCILPVVMMDKRPAPKEFGEFKIKGMAELLIKKNEKSNRVYLNCISNIVIENDFLGNFYAEKGKIYELSFTTVGRNPILNRNNIWVANRNLDNILKDSIETKVKHISSKI